MCAHFLAPQFSFSPLLARKKSLASLSHQACFLGRRLPCGCSQVSVTLQLHGMDLLQYLELSFGMHPHVHAHACVHRHCTQAGDRNEERFIFIHDFSQWSAQPTAPGFGGGRSSMRRVWSKNGGLTSQGQEGVEGGGGDRGIKVQLQECNAVQTSRPGTHASVPTSCFHHLPVGHFQKPNLLSREDLGAVLEVKTTVAGQS